VPTSLPYYVASTGGNFTLNITAASFTSAEESCRARGARLAYFSSQAEQAEVRQRGGALHLARMLGCSCCSGCRSHAHEGTA
jgi:hypothetical protein